MQQIEEDNIEEDKKFTKLLLKTSLYDAMNIYKLILKINKNSIIENIFDSNSIIYRGINLNSRDGYDEWKLKSKKEQLLDELVHYNKKITMKRLKLNVENNVIKYLSIKSKCTGDISTTSRLNIYKMDYRSYNTMQNALFIPCFIIIGDDYLRKIILKEYLIIQTIKGINTTIYIATYMYLEHLHSKYKDYFSKITVTTSLHNIKFSYNIIYLNTNTQGLHPNISSFMKTEFIPKIDYLIQSDQLYFLLNTDRFYITRILDIFMKFYFVHKLLYYLKYINEVYKSKLIYFDEILYVHEYNIIVSYNDIKVQIIIDYDENNNLKFWIENRDYIDPKLVSYLTLENKKLSSENISNLFKYFIPV